MGIFDRFTSKKEKELKVAEAPKADKAAKAEKPAKAEKAKKVVAKKETKKESKVETKAAAVDMTGTLKAPVVTEKTTRLASMGKYAFEVNVDATKIDVRRAVEKAYGVHVTDVRVQNVRGKVVRFGRTLGKRSSWKKALVTLKPGERLDIYEAAAK